MALKLTLKPGEKLVINGAVIENGDRRAVLVVKNRASILREKDIMQPAQADTPMRRIYFAVMMLYLDEGSHRQYYDEVLLRTRARLEPLLAMQPEWGIGRVDTFNPYKLIQFAVSAANLTPEEKRDFVFKRLMQWGMSMVLIAPPLAWLVLVVPGWL